MVVTNLLVIQGDIGSCDVVKNRHVEALCIDNTGHVQSGGFMLMSTVSEPAKVTPSLEFKNFRICKRKPDICELKSLNTNGFCNLSH